jgi:hypothetical protein
MRKAFILGAALALFVVVQVVALRVGDLPEELRR